MLKEEYKIARQIIVCNTAGYFYDDNKKINYSGYYKEWYTKEYIHPATIIEKNIKLNEALSLIKSSLL